MMRSRILLGAMMVAATGTLHAQSPAPDRPDGDPSRFSFHRTDHGYVRLDRRSGEVSSCARGKNGWECLTTADERAAYESEIGRLQAENAALKKALLEKGLSLPKGGTAAPPAVAEKPPPEARTPSDAEIDRIMSVFERIWRRLVEMMANLQRDLNKT
ncbi:MAG: hypothetical protein R3D62_14845 [Xanthobacteraceae bacterium]